MSHWHSYTSYSVFYDGSEMTADQIEFLLAIASYQKRFERRFPTWLEVLNILHCLGYRKVADAVPIDEPKPPTADGLSEFERMKAKFAKKEIDTPAD